MNDDNATTHDGRTGRPNSAAFVAARALARAAEDRERDAQRGGADAEEVARLHAEWLNLAGDALAMLDADRRGAADNEADDRLAAALAAPLEHAVALAVATLRMHGPMTAAELEARRLRGLSHNAVRPVLREARERGLAESMRNGRRVEWFSKDR